MTDYNWQDWSDWILLETLDLDEIPNTPGTYIIGAHREISRANGNDPHVMLDVGETGNLGIPEAFGH